MWSDNLKLREKIYTLPNIKYGVEIEFVGAKREKVAKDLRQAYVDSKILKPWKVEIETSLMTKNSTKSPDYNGEAISSILTDESKDWHNIEYTCQKIKQNNGYINNHCGAHVHVGADIFEDNLKYYSRLIKLWTIFEDIIVKFGYGEFTTKRANFDYYAKSSYDFYSLIENFYKNDKQLKSFDTFIKVYASRKYTALSLRRLDLNYLKQIYSKFEPNLEQYKTIEFRVGAGTLSPAILQNYTNFYTKLMLCCLDDSKDWDFVDKLYYYYTNCREKVKNLLTPEFLCDFVFDKELDKNYFFTQFYKKDYCQNSTTLKH